MGGIVATWQDVCAAGKRFGYSISGISISLQLLQ